MRIRGIVLLLVAVLLFSQTGCGKKEEESFDGVTLTIMGRVNEMDKEYLMRIFELYEAATGNRLKLITLENTEIDAAAAAALTEGNGPDILLHYNNSMLSKLDVSRNFLSLNEEAWVDDLTDGARDYCRDEDGNIIGLPFWESSVSGCYYNKTLLDSLGLKPAVTQAEFDALCQALVSIGLTPLCWPTDSGVWMYQFGIDPIFADDPALLEKINTGQISYADIPAMTDLAEWVDRAAKNGWFGRDFLSTGWNEMSSIMSSGEAVMIFIWDTWFYTDFEANGRYTKEDFALMPVFMNTADKGTYEGGNLNMMMVNKNSARVEEALDFLAFCAEPKNYDKAFDGISTISCFKGQTTNIQSPMVTAAAASIAANQRPSTAEPKINGYRQEDVSKAFRKLFEGEADVKDCIRLMDTYRIVGARKEE